MPSPIRQSASAEESAECARCRSRRQPYSSVSHTGIYEELLREAILRSKQRGAEPLVYALGQRLAARVSQNIDTFSPQPELVTATPMHWRRRIARGINVAAIVAAAVAKELRLPLALDLLVCRRAIAKQSQLPASRRRRNVRGAFRLAWRYDIANASVLLVDDVMTTGATVHEISRVLRGGGAARVDVAVIGRATELDW